MKNAKKEKGYKYKIVLATANLDFILISIFEKLIGRLLQALINVIHIHLTVSHQHVGQVALKSQ